MVELLDARQPVDAIVCVSDLAAFGALTECQRRGVSVPDEVMIAGFGAYDIAEVALPGLTTMDAHSMAIGTRTGELLVALLRGGTDGATAKRVSHIEPTSYDQNQRIEKHKK